MDGNEQEELSLKIDICAIEAMRQEEALRISEIVFRIDREDKEEFEKMVKDSSGSFGESRREELNLETWQAAIKNKPSGCLDKKDLNGLTPLHIAAVLGQEKTVQNLLYLGAKADITVGSSDITAADLAAANNHENILEILAIKKHPSSSPRKIRLSQENVLQL